MTKEAISTERALKLALDALDEFCELGAIIRPLEVRDALREALASQGETLAEQPAQQRTEELLEIFKDVDQCGPLLGMGQPAQQEPGRNHYEDGDVFERIAAMKRRTAEQEPVAVRLWDSQWVNVVNHDNCYRDWSKEDAINHAVKMTEKYIAGNVADNKLPPAQRTWVGLTDEEIWKFWWSRPEIQEGEDDSMEAEFVAAVRRVLADHGIKGDA